MKPSSCVEPETVLAEGDVVVMEWGWSILFWLFNKLITISSKCLTLSCTSAVPCCLAGRSREESGFWKSHDSGVPLFVQFEQGNNRSHFNLSYVSIFQPGFWIRTSLLLPTNCTWQLRFVPTSTWVYWDLLRATLLFSSLEFSKHLQTNRKEDEDYGGYWTRKLDVLSSL